MYNMQKTREQLFGTSISPAAALAFSLGTSLGWGSLVVTCNSYLLQAGPVGSVIGMAVGGLIMFLVARNYYYLMNCLPDAGGSYAFARDVFGHDYGFLTAWFLVLTYLAVFWANATAIPLFARNFFGEFFHFGYMYTVFGYSVYAGEVLLTICVIGLVILFLTHSNNMPVHLMTFFAILFTAGLTICFAAGILKHDRPFTPYFISGSSSLSQVIRIAMISPWAFIGFENISHFSTEFSFSWKKIFRVFVISVFLTTALYIFVMLLSVTAYPPQYASWFEYIRDLGNLSGVDAIPAFYAARHYLGDFGVWTLILVLASLVITSLIGNAFALSRIFYALGRDGIFPKCVSELNEKHIPVCAFRLIFLISLIIPFLGRTAIGWIVDVTTLGATIVYAIVSAAAYKLAKEQKDKLETITGLAALVIMALFMLNLLVPNLTLTGSMEPASYILFVVWSVLGFIFFRWILSRDEKARFGRSIIVWIGLLSLTLFISLVWMSQSTLTVTGNVLNEVEYHYTGQDPAEEDDKMISEEMDLIRRANTRSILIVIALFGTSLIVLLNNYKVMMQRAQKSESQLAFFSQIANIDSLTGVKSKHAFSERERMTNEEISSGSAEPFAVVVCDVNGLKHINDTYGHKAGDAYIKSASETICEIFAHSPVFRTGGDEFVVYLTGRDYEDRQNLMALLHQKSADHIGSDLVVISGGISDYVPGEDQDIHAVFERADKLMYEEKQTLKNMGAKTR